MSLAAVNSFFEDIMHAKVGLEEAMIFQDLQVEIKQYAQDLSYNQIVLMFDQLTEAHKN